MNERWIRGASASSVSHARHTTTRFPTRLTGLQVFEKEVEVFPVSTGTAANCQPSSPKTDCTRVPDG